MVDSTTASAAASAPAPELPKRRLRWRMVWPSLLVIPATVWALIRLFGLERGAILVQLISFTPYVAAASLIPLGATLVARRWIPAAAAALACAVLASCVLPRTLGSPERPASGVSVKFMSLNMRVGGADPAAVVALVRDHRVDVLVLQEFTPAAQTALEAQSLTTLLPYWESLPIAGVQGSALYSRFPLADGDSRLNPGGFGQAYAGVLVPGASRVRVESVHPMPPLTENMGNWRAGIQDEPPATVDGQLQVLIGDFNSTLDHAELRRLLGTGYRDAASVVGAGFTPTWPFDGDRVAITPKITIDHVFADRRLAVRDFSATTVPNTDHRAIFCTLVIGR